MAICVLIICGGVPFAILFCVQIKLLFGIAIESVICYFMLAAKSLKQAGMRCINRSKTVTLTAHEKRFYDCRT